jgi:hypothetical protein
VRLFGKPGARSSEIGAHAAGGTNHDQERALFNKHKILDGADGGATGISVLRNGRMFGGGRQQPYALSSLPPTETLCPGWELLILERLAFLAP